MVFTHVTDDQAAGCEEVARFVAGQYQLPPDALERWCLIGPAAGPG